MSNEIKECCDRCWAHDHSQCGNSQCDCHEDVSDLWGWFNAKMEHWNSWDAFCVEWYWIGQEVAYPVGPID